MKAIFGMSGFLVCVMLFITALPACCNQTVTVVGVAAIAGGATDTARSQAISDACRNAVKQGLNVWISSTTDVQNTTVICEQILGKADGYVTHYEVIKEGADGDKYSVTLSAEVADERIGADFKQLVGIVKTQLGTPTVAFVLTTWEAKGPQTTTSTTDTVDASVKNHDTDAHSASNATTSSTKVDANLRTSEKGLDKDKSATSDKASISESDKSSESANVSASASEAARIKAAAAARDTDDSASVAASAREDYKGKASVKENDSSSDSANVKASSASSQSDRYSHDYAGSVKGKDDEASSASDKGASDAASSSDLHAKVKEDTTVFTIDETLWKKYPDPQIIDAFQQEFKEKRFDIMAADKAREIALTESPVGTSVNWSDREAVRTFAQKEGANFVARGEVRILSSIQSESTGNYDVISQIGVEIIDVNSGDVVASYSNTVTASNTTMLEAKAQSILKAAVVGARTLAGQTIDTWQERALNGSQFTIEVGKIKSIRGQQVPFLRMIAACAQITSQVNPADGDLLVRVLYKGSKSKLEDDILAQLDGKPGFSEQEFDGPKDKDGHIYFEFMK